MRRIIGGSAAFLVLTGTLLVLPVYAAPAPEAHPVETQIDEVSLGSVTDPEGDAVVAVDGEVQTHGVEDGGAPTTAPSTSPSPTAEPQASTPPAPGASSAAPTSGGEVADGEAVVSGDELPGVPALTISQPDTDEFQSIGVTWAEDPSVVDVVAQIRLQAEDGTWGDWTTLDPDDVEQTVTLKTEDNDVRGGTAPYWTGGSFGVEAIVQSADGTVPQDVRLTLLDPGSSPADELTGVTPAGTAHAADAMPQVFTRAQWGADESIRTWDPEYAPTIKAATIHHTADGNNYTADQVPAMMRAIYAYHSQAREWGDIGYNVIVDKYGRIFEGRYGGLASTVIGAHAGGFNTGTFGVSMLGNYDTVAVPQATVNAVAEIIAWKFGLYGVDPRGTTVLTSAGGGTSRYAAGVRVTLPTIFGHRDVGSTTCPGQYGYARLGEIRERVMIALPRFARVTTTVTNASTGYIPDVSPVQVSAVTSTGGLSTAFVRGADNSIWYSTALGGGGYGPWQSVPSTGARSGPSLAMSDGTTVHLVIRGNDNAIWYNTATLQSNGRPGTWAGWASLGGAGTTAATIASLGAGRLAVVTRGSDGAAWERLATGGIWAPWVTLGGSSYSAPVVQADQANNRYVVSVVGSDNRIWQVGMTESSSGPAGGWIGGGVYSSLAPGTNGASAASGGGTVLSLGSFDHSVVLYDTSTGLSVDVGGSVTSVVGLSRQPDGSTMVLGRGGDASLWGGVYRAGQPFTWSSLGGRLQ